MKTHGRIRKDAPQVGPARRNQTSPGAAESARTPSALEQGLVYWRNQAWGLLAQVRERERELAAAHTARSDREDGLQQQIDTLRAECETLEAVAERSREQNRRVQGAYATADAARSRAELEALREREERRAVETRLAEAAATAAATVEELRQRSTAMEEREAALVREIADQSGKIARLEAALQQQKALIQGLGQALKASELRTRQAEDQAAAAPAWAPSRLNHPFDVKVSRRA
ncbi:MAG: hypothetical protein ACO3Z6_00245 [Pseudomonadales bacterium]